MKRFLCIMILFLCLAGCKEKESTLPEVHYTYDIVSEKVDMSAYEGVSSTDHHFRIIGVSQLFNCIDHKSSGIFYLGRENCNCCQKVCKYIDQVAKELNVTVYYIDVYDENEPLSDKEVQDKLYDYLYDILGKDENGDKTLLTPHVFSVIDGEFYGSQICFDDYILDSNSSDEQVEKFKDSYRYIMKPFAE